MKAICEHQHGPDYKCSELNANDFTLAMRYLGTCDDDKVEGLLEKVASQLQYHRAVGDFLYALVTGQLKFKSATSKDQGKARAQSKSTTSTFIIEFFLGTFRHSIIL